MHISRETRSDIVDYLVLSGRPFHGDIDLLSFLGRVWNLSSMKAVDSRHRNAFGDIQTHVVQFSDWDYNYLLYDYLKILDCDDERFAAFVEMCLSPLAVSDQQQIDEMLSVFNAALQRDGYQLVIDGRRAGKPMYRVVEYKPDQLPQEDERKPLLDQAAYQRILQIIHDTGKAFERLPATYYNKGEEDLRDHLLLQLEPHFNARGSVTGETFNKVGKTDILIRYANSTIFIAECKFWKGEAQYLETISQLLGYLTWRDSKAAVIIFVKNKEISSVLETVKRVTPKHPNFLGFVDERDASWLNYRFHINNDPGREVKLGVMLYHIPDVYSGRVKRRQV